MNLARPISVISMVLAISVACAPQAPDEQSAASESLTTDNGSVNSDAGGNQTQTNTEPAAGSTDSSSGGVGLAFPTAAGFGATTKGGRGGKVLVVSTLRDSGPGSFREAVETPGPRIVVFALAGTIELAKPLTITHPYITVAGQTAPGQGITIIGDSFRIQTSEVILRYLRFRIDASDRSSFSFDGASNVILDHVSGSWPIEGDLKVSDTKDFTIQWSIIAGAPNSSASSASSDVERNCSVVKESTRVSLHHNIWSQCYRRTSPDINDGRNPSMVEVVNNLIHGDVFQNGDDSKIFASLESPGKVKVHFLTNIYLLDEKWADQIMVDSKLRGSYKLHMNNNFDLRTGKEIDGFSEEYPTDHDDELQRDTLFTSPLTNMTHASNLLNALVNRAGSITPARDAVDKEILADLRAMTRPIDWPSATVSAGPVGVGSSAPTDSDGDGMPDAWEKAQGLNPSVDDSAGRMHGGTYTNIEIYINSLVDS